MYEGYLKIGDFAKLRNLSKRTIRYYESLGLVKSYVPKKETGYRYYHENQVLVLDAIKICTTVGISLKTLSNYVRDDYNFNYQDIINLCHDHASHVFHTLDCALRTIQENMQCKDDCERFIHKKQPYVRTIPERHIVCRKLKKFGTYAENQLELAKLHIECDDRDIHISHTFGIFQKPTENHIDYYVFTQVIETHADNPAVIDLPAGDYLCHPSLERYMTIPEEFMPIMSQGKEKIILSTFMLFDIINLKEPTYEKQILMSEGDIIVPSDCSL